MNNLDVIRSFASSCFSSISEEKTFSSYLAVLEALNQNNKWLRDEKLVGKVLTRLTIIEPKSSEECLKTLMLFQKIKSSKLELPFLDKGSEMQELLTEMENNSISISSTGIVCVKEPCFQEKQWDCLNKLSRCISMTQIKFSEVKDLNKLLEFSKQNSNITLLDLGETQGIDDDYLEILSTYLPSIKIFSIHSNKITTIPETICEKLIKLDCTGCRSLTTIKVSNVIELVCINCEVLTVIYAPLALMLSCMLCKVLRTIDASNLTHLNCQDCTALQSITAPNVKKLYCMNCPSLTTIEAPNVVKIGCKNCPSLTTIDAINIKYLSCEDCSALKKIIFYDLLQLLCDNCTALQSITAPNVEELYCMNCSNLTTIEAPNVVKIDCKNCPSLTTIDAINIKYLSCEDCCALKKIIFYDLLQLLCDNCTALQSITAPNVEELYCKNCSNLTTITAVIVSTLDCTNCTSLVTLTAPKVKKLNCTGCIAVKTLLALFATELNCSGCKALTMISAPNVVELNCNNCEAIKTITADKALRINCRNCTALTFISALKVSVLDCSKCTALVKIYCDASNIQFLNLSYCPLQNINVPNATTLICNHCRVQTIFAPKALTISCENCLDLVAIEAPKVKFLNFSGCFYLKSISTPVVETLNCSYTDIKIIDAPNATKIDCKSCRNLTTILAPKIMTLDCSECKFFEINQTFENFINLTTITLSEDLDNFTRLKIFLELGKTSERRELLRGKIFARHFDPFLKIILKGLSFNELNYLNLFCSIDRKRSSFRVFIALFILAQIFPEKRGEVFFPLYDPKVKKKIIDRKISDDFILKNKKSLQEILQREDLNEKKFFLNLILGIVLNNSEILKKVLAFYFKSENKKIHGTLFVNKEIKAFFKTENGKELLIKYRESIFKREPKVVEFIEKVFPFSKEKNIHFYPIKIIEEVDEISIDCLQSHTRNSDNLIEILRKLAKTDLSKKIKVKYFGQNGIDVGALKKDFITNLFYTASKYWNLNKNIPTIERTDLAHLGPLLKYVINSKGFNKLSIGEIFHENFFKGIFEFDFKQIESNSLNDLEIQRILASGYNKDVREVLDFLEWNDFSDSKKNRVYIETLIKFYVKDGLCLDSELTSLIGYDNFESSIETLIKLTLLNKLPLDDNLIDFIGRNEYEKVEKEDDKTKISFIKNNIIKIENWIKEDLEIRTMILKLNLRCLDGGNLDQESMNLINDEDFEIKFQLIQNKKKMNSIKKWLEKDLNRLDELRKIFRDEVLSGFVDQVKNIHIILRSMNLSEDEWLAIKAKGVEPFKIQIQGAFSKKRFLKRIVFKGVIDKNNVETKFDQTTKDHLTEWFKNASGTTLKKFTKYVTGLAETPILSIKFFHNSQFSVHACFNHIDIPIGLTKEQIFEYMNYIVADEKGSFDLS